MANKAVIFDIDDTLIHTSDYSEINYKDTVFAMIEKVTKGRGLPERNIIRGKERLKRILNTNEDYIHGNAIQLLVNEYRMELLVSAMRGNTKAKDWLQRMDPEHIAEIGLEEFKKIKEVKLQRNIGTRDTLEFLLERNFKLGIVTTGTPRHQIEKLKLTGLYDYFKGHILASRDSAEVKPLPVLYNRVLAGMDADPGKSFYVGNRVDVDVLGAHNAGMKSILLVCGKWMGECATSTLLKKNKADLSGFMQELLEDKHLKDVAKYVPDYTIYALKEIMDIREIRNAI